MAEGKIFNIQKYSIHDGPGIRTTVFLKGCPLHCQWCHNPESQGMMEQLMFYPDRCIGCRRCVAVCPHEAIQFSSAAGSLSFQREKCWDCGACAGVCVSGARELAGRNISVEEVIAEVEKDRIFYDESGGGVTLSGGEPLMQPQFLRDLLEQCRKRDFHTTVETCGLANADLLKEISSRVDLFFYDLKLMDAARHEAYTGVGNGQILANLRLLADIQANVIVRIPVLPGINTDEENIRQSGEFVASLKRVKEVHLLPYHKGGMEKYKRLGLSYRLPEMAPPENALMNKLADWLREYGLGVKLGG